MYMIELFPYKPYININVIQQVSEAEEIALNEGAYIVLTNKEYIRFLERFIIQVKD